MTNHNRANFNLPSICRPSLSTPTGHSNQPSIDSCHPLPSVIGAVVRRHAITSSAISPLVPFPPSARRNQTISGSAGAVGAISCPSVGLRPSRRHRSHRPSVPATASVNASVLQSTLPSFLPTLRASLRTAGPVRQSDSEPGQFVRPSQSVQPSTVRRSVLRPSFEAAIASRRRPATIQRHQRSVGRICIRRWCQAFCVYGCVCMCVCVHICVRVHACVRV